MHIIALTSQKGGTGKTTLSGHLAVQAARNGYGPVALIDTDPQGSLTQWSAARGGNELTVVSATVSTLDNEIARLREDGVKTLFIDTPPAITWTIIEVVKFSNLVLIPVRPSPHDLAAAGTTVDLVEHLGKPLVFIVNGASQRAKITGEAAIALSQHGTVALTTVHNRTDFAASMIDGRTVMELRNAQRSTAEIEGLWRYIAERLNREDRLSRASTAMPQVLDPLSRSRTDIGALS